jgi:hypothetical protein
MAKKSRFDFAQYQDITLAPASDREVSNLEVAIDKGFAGAILFVALGRAGLNYPDDWDYRYRADSFKAFYKGVLMLQVTAGSQEALIPKGIIVDGVNFLPHSKRKSQQTCKHKRDVSLLQRVIDTLCSNR